MSIKNEPRMNANMHEFFENRDMPMVRVKMFLLRCHPETRKAGEGSALLLFAGPRPTTGGADSSASQSATPE
jgi:hypothetical protein